MMRLAISALALLTASASTPALAAARQDAEVVMPWDPAAFEVWEDWGFSDAIVIGDTIYLSGVVARVREGETDRRAANGLSGGTEVLECARVAVIGPRPGAVNRQVGKTPRKRSFRRLADINQWSLV
jgi:hypothetical protein